MKLSILGLGLNLFLNIGLVFGKFGFPEMGLLGSATATLISRILIFIAMWLVYKRSDVSKPYLTIQKADNQYFINLLKISIPMAFQLFFEVAAFCGAGIMVGWFPGEQAIIGRDAHQIALNMASGTFMVFIGLSVAGSVRVGEAFGRGNQADIVKAGKATLSMGIAFAVLSATFLILFREKITALYGIHDAAVQSVTIRLIVIAAIFQLFDGTQCIGAGLLRGIQDVKIPTLITFIAYWVIWIPLAYYLGFILNLGIDGIWYADVIALAFAAICLNWRFFRLGKEIIA
jgi:MATE family multidrug resistance protein